LALPTATERIQDLEARVNALEEEKVKWVGIIQEGVRIIQEEAEMRMGFMQKLTELIKASDSSTLRE
jgi:hypothetical protein